jgi:hypothetical protein
MGFDDGSNLSMLFVSVRNGVLNVFHPETGEVAEHESYTGVVAGFRNVYLDATKSKFPGHRLQIMMYDPAQPDTLVRLETTTYGDASAHRPTTATSMLVRTLADPENNFLPMDKVQIRVRKAMNPETREVTKGTTVFVNRVGGVATSIPKKPKDEAVERDVVSEGIRLLEKRYGWPDLRGGWEPPESYDQAPDEESYNQIPPEETKGGFADAPHRTQDEIPEGDTDPRKDDLPF